MNTTTAESPLPFAVVGLLSFKKNENATLLPYRAYSVNII